jgi:hypothetical protein
LIVCIAVVAFVAELLLYPAFGMGAALTLKPEAPRSGPVFLLFALMALTVSIGILAPIGALWEARLKRENYGLRMMVGGVAGVVIGLIVLFLIE